MLIAKFRSLPAEYHEAVSFALAHPRRAVAIYEETDCIAEELAEAAERPGLYPVQPMPIPGGNTQRGWTS